ncbi:MAG: hypothetical protein ABSE73_04845 [Planctomycetota bacterium]
MQKLSMRYKPEVKARIIAAAAAARAAGKRWREAHAAAQGAGFRGNIDNLMKLMTRKAGKVGRPRLPANAAAPAAAPRKRGRPPKAAAPATPALDPVAANYLFSAIGKAIAELERLRRQYAK